MMYDHIPGDLRSEIYAWLSENAKDERKPTDTDEQFYYKSRKKAIGPFKRQLWDLPADVSNALANAYEQKFEFLFKQLAIGGTMDHVRKYVRAPEQRRPMPRGEAAFSAAAHDDAEAGE
jgi:hypothetical protein